MSDECICGEINARNCPVHNDVRLTQLPDLNGSQTKAREFWLNPLDKDKMMFMDTPPALDSCWRYHVIERSAYLAAVDGYCKLSEECVRLTREMEEWKNRETLWTEMMGRQTAATDEARAEIERLREVLSYLPKVPTQPYEKELARQIIEARAEVERLKSLPEIAKRVGAFVHASALAQRDELISECEQVLTQGISGKTTPATSDTWVARAERSLKKIKELKK